MSVRPHIALAKAVRRVIEGVRRQMVFLFSPRPALHNGVGRGGGVHARAWGRCLAAGAVAAAAAVCLRAVVARARCTAGAEQR
jgi:hypothetical protein